MMRRRWIGLLGVATLGFVSVHLCVAGVALCVNEAATRIRLHDDRIEVSLAVENPWGRPLAAHIHLELLDPQDRVRAGVERDQTIPPGSSTTVIPLALAASRLKQEDKRQILWYRMRYRVTPDPSAKVPVEPGEGLLAVAEITSDVFDLHVVGLGYVNEGGRYRARVRATHPVTSRPVVGVAVEAELDLVDLARGWVDEPRLLARVVDEALVAGAVELAHGQAAPFEPVAVEVAEPCVAVAVGVLFQVLEVEQLQGDAGPSALRVDPGAVGRRALPLARHLRPAIEPALQHVVTQRLDLKPVQPGPLGPHEDAADRAQPDPEALSHRPVAQPQGPLLPQDFPDLPHG